MDEQQAREIAQEVGANAVRVMREELRYEVAQLFRQVDALSDRLDELVKRVNRGV